jgi:hypothetical protein
MHELLHFYTWHTFGKKLLDQGLLKLVYNNIKESLTEILNLEFSDLMGGKLDSGYPQHQAMRQKFENFARGVLANCEQNFSLCCHLRYSVDWIKEYNNKGMTNSRQLRYKGMSVNMFGLPSFNSSKKKKNIQIPKREYLCSFVSDFKKDAPKNLLLIYDIPEGRKKERDWFRRQLKNFDFIMIQKSVWVGPSPLPENFNAYLKRIDLQKEFKTFKLAKSYVEQSTP